MIPREREKPSPLVLAWSSAVLWERGVGRGEELLFVLSRECRVAIRAFASPFSLLQRSLRASARLGGGECVGSCRWALSTCPVCIYTDYKSGGHAGFRFNVKRGEGGVL